MFEILFPFIVALVVINRHRAYQKARQSIEGLATSVEAFQTFIKEEPQTITIGKKTVRIFQVWEEADQFLEKAEKQLKWLRFGAAQKTVNQAYATGGPMAIRCEWDKQRHKTSNVCQN